MAREVTSHMKAGYPRFFLNPMMERLFADAKMHTCDHHEDLVLFPNSKAVQRAQLFVEKRISSATRISNYEGLQCLIVPSEHINVAREYWRYAGEIVSTRNAENILNNTQESIANIDSLLQDFSSLLQTSQDSLYFYESGMSAFFAAFRASIGMSPNKKTLQLEFPYVDSLKIQQHFGSGVVYLNECEGEPFAEAIKRIKSGEFSAVFCEIPSNPLLRSIDVKTISEACREGGTPLVIDDTVCSSYNVDVTKYADIIVTSLTKWISGKGDVMAGMIHLPEQSPLHQQLLDFFRLDNPTQSKLYPDDLNQLRKNSAGFTERIKLANQNGLELTEFLIRHPDIDQVWHPSITSKELYDIYKKDTGGYGGLISFTLRQQKKTAKFFDLLELSKGPSLGTEFSLVCPYTMLAHYDELEWAENCGVPANLIRISTGSEPTGYLTDIFTKALNSIK